MIRKIVYILVLILLLGLLFSLSKQLLDTLQTGSRLDQENLELINLQRKNAELKNKLQEVETLGFIEQQARDKLNLARGGETVVVIPQSEIDKINQAQKPPEPVKLPNWQGWLRLFFK